MSGGIWRLCGSVEGELCGVCPPTFWNRSILTIGLFWVHDVQNYESDGHHEHQQEQDNQGHLQPRETPLRHLTHTQTQHVHKRTEWVITKANVINTQ